MRTIALSAAFFTFPLLAQSTFEVATIKPSADCDTPRGGPGANGTLTFACTTVATLILSYDRAGSGAVVTPTSRRIQILGGPDWIQSARYDIQAKASGNPNASLMMGPMLQALLEDRFQLKIHRETREAPVYAMTVAKGGLKMQPRTAPCPPPFALDTTKPPAEAIAEARKAASSPDACGMSMGRVGPNRQIQLRGLTMAEFARNLTLNEADLPVIDRTGVTGTFNFRLEFAPNDLAADAPSGPSLFTALEEQLGLKLERT